MQGRFTDKEIETMREKGMLAKVDAVVRLAQELGCTPTQLALAYCLKNPQVSSLLFGATKISQVHENLKTLELLPRVDDRVMRELRNLS